MRIIWQVMTGSVWANTAYKAHSLHAWDIQQACASYDTKLVSWDSKINLWGIHEIHETEVTVASPGRDLSHVFPVGKTWCFPAVRQSLLLLCSCHLTCVFIALMIPWYENPNRWCSYDTVIQICPRNTFFQDLSSCCTGTLYPDNIRKRTDFFGFPIVKPSAHLFFLFILRHMSKDALCAAWIAVLCNHTRLETFFQSTSKNWAETAIFIIFAVSSSVLN